ncbi:MAG: transglycosylase domain-containing protein, partial [Flavitalea sp.]
MSRSVSIFWKIFLSGLLILILILTSITLGLFGKMPSLAQLENPSITLASTVYGDDATKLGSYFKEKGNRTNVQFKDISKHIVNALVATEDERFYEHSGIDGKAVMRAVVLFGRQGGGSTITQQLALNMFAERSKNPVSRIIQKLKEWIIAVKLERNFTKQEILALYLNTVSFSDNVYGIRNAAITFFSKEPDRLNVEESAVLIGMLKATGNYNPRTNYKASFDRRNTVIDQLVRNAYLPEATATGIKKNPIRLNYKKLDQNNGIAPYFLDVIREELKKWCSEHEKPDGDNYDLYEDGLKIYTAINPRMQEYAEEAVARNMPSLQKVLSGQKSVKNDA